MMYLKEKQSNETLIKLHFQSKSMDCFYIIGLSVMKELST